MSPLFGHLLLILAMHSSKMYMPPSFLVWLVGHQRKLVINMTILDSNVTNIRFQACCFYKVSLCTHFETQSNDKNVGKAMSEFTKPAFNCLKPLFHSSQKPTRKPAASAFKYYDWLKVLASQLASWLL